MEVLSLNTMMMSRTFYNFTKNWECSRLHLPEYCEKPYHEFLYGRVSLASSAGKPLYPGDFLCKLIEQMPYREIDQNMKSFLLCNCLRNVEHICEIRAWVRNPLFARKYLSLYSRAIPFCVL